MSSVDQKVPDVATAYRLLREQGEKLRDLDADKPPEKDEVKKWRMRVEALVNSQHPQTRQDVLHHKLQKLLFDLEDAVLVKFPHFL